MKTGKSATSRTTFGYNWEGSRTLEISTQDRAAIALELLSPLGLMREQWKKALNGDSSSLKGTLVFDSFEFSGRSSSLPSGR